MPAGHGCLSRFSASVTGAYSIGIRRSCLLLRAFGYSVWRPLHLSGRSCSSAWQKPASRPAWLLSPRNQTYDEAKHHGRIQFGAEWLLRAPGKCFWRPWTWCWFRVGSCFFYIVWIRINGTIKIIQMALVRLPIYIEYHACFGFEDFGFPWNFWFIG